MYVRFRHSGYGYDGYLDDVRIVADDLAGPRVTGLSPVSVASDGGPLSQVRVTFDEPIAPTSFTTEDVVMKDAQGALITPVGVAAVDGSGDTQFDLSFAAQELRGQYRLAMGPQVTDVAGNPMNQDGDATNGEGVEDIYNGAVTFEPTVWSPAGAVPNLYVEDFEGWTSTPSYWSFITSGAGTVSAVSSGTPHGGTRHLKFAANGGGYLTQYATVAVDLSSVVGRSDLFLDFWSRRSSDGWLRVELSGDGTTFQEVWSSGLSASYTNYTLDLDVLAASKGIALDAAVYVRFRHSGYGYDGYLDDVRISTPVAALTPTPTPTLTPTVTPTSTPTETPTITPEVSCFTDVDVSGPPAGIGTDVVYIARTLLGFTPVPSAFRLADPSIPPDAFIAANVDAARTGLDVDQRNGTQIATDVVYIARRMLGFVPVPPAFRIADPTIPPDAEISDRIDALCRY